MINGNNDVFITPLQISKQFNTTSGTLRKWAAKVIARGCHDWLYKPKCKDNTIGIVPRIHLTYL